MQKFLFQERSKKPFIIAGPCLAESPDLMLEIAKFMKPLEESLGFNYIFKASFDKANRTSFQSERGPGWKKSKNWFIDVKEKLNLPILTDIHESHQAQDVAEVCDILQIPAFLCRQTDLILSACQTGKMVNIKKGQFLSPEATNSLVFKIKENHPNKNSCMLTERGTSFGYGDLVVDMRSFQLMAQTESLVCFDLTHSLQKPASSGKPGEESLGARQFAPSLARAAIASSYVDGIFMEVHPEPEKANSDKKTQLNFKQAELILKQIIPLWHSVQKTKENDHLFNN